MIRSLLSIAVTIIVVVSCTPEASGPIGLAVGTRAPVVRLPTVAGDTIDLADYVGKRTVVITFWATWCPSCRGLERALRAAHEQYGREVAFIHIAVPQHQTPQRVGRHAERHRLPGLVAFDAQGATVAAFHVPLTSYAVVIDRRGTIVYTGVGSRQDIVAELTKLK